MGRREHQPSVLARERLRPAEVADVRVELRRAFLQPRELGVLEPGIRVPAWELPSRLGMHRRELVPTPARARVQEDPGSDFSLIRGELDEVVAVPGAFPAARRHAPDARASGAAGWRRTTSAQRPRVRCTNDPSPREPLSPSWSMEAVEAVREAIRRQIDATGRHPAADVDADGGGDHRALASGSPSRSWRPCRGGRRASAPGARRGSGAGRSPPPASRVSSSSSLAHDSTFGAISSGMVEP